MSIGTVPLAVFAAEVVVVLVCSAVMANLVVRESPDLLYAEGVSLLAATLVVTAVATVMYFVHTVGIAGGVRLNVAADVTYALAAALSVVSMWYFARDFVRTSDRSVDDGDGGDGGFEDA